MNAKTHFFDLGFRYYVVGRFSVLARLSTVAGNQLHHAIEMFLKGHLAGTTTLDDLRKKYGHRLHDLWSGFKADQHDASLSRFDDVVQRLHEFESIRYPDRVMKEGMVCEIGIPKFTPGTDFGPEPRFSLSLEEIDEMAEVIVRRASINPFFYTQSISADAERYLTQENKWLNSARP